ncbi:AAA family ATPase [Bifidobacterium animalis]|uniref:ABC transporter ATP-binding protein n=1 Tax=Bifidobacterium animalis subsp. lactis TaxID=302911 RepID=A0A8B3RHM3_BIFAN|nr:AAA family ATPase [Bifidobacterium animalis]RYM94338.1 ABC transporter ATP-binding protein [Bifidobacterium animalis subsp. lactis]
MVCGFSAEGGSRNYRFSTYDDCSDLADALILYRKRAIPPSSFFLRAESFFTMATQARDYDRGRSAMSALHEMSHGEGFLEIMLSRNAPGLYLMDEPESALSAGRQLALLAHMHRLAEQGAQFIVATHSPILLGLPGAQILQFDDDGVRRVTTRTPMPTASPHRSSIIGMCSCVICLRMRNGDIAAGNLSCRGSSADLRSRVWAPCEENMSIVHSGTIGDSLLNVSIWDNISDLVE